MFKQLWIDNELTVSFSCHVTWVTWSQAGVIMSSGVSLPMSEYYYHHGDNAAENCDNGSDNSNDDHDHIIVITNNHCLKSNLTLSCSLLSQSLSVCQQCYCRTLKIKDIFKKSKFTLNKILKSIDKFEKNKIQQERKQDPFWLIWIGNLHFKLFNFDLINNVFKN